MKFIWFQTLGKMFQLYLAKFTFLRFISNLKKRRKFIFFGQTTRGIHRPLKLLYSKNALYMLKSQVRKLIFDEL